jgi:nucleotide-binding universal stress UspA family protein
MTTLIVATDGSDLAIRAALAGLSLTKRPDKLLVVCAVDHVDPSIDATGHPGPTRTHEQAKASQREVKAEGEPS